MFRFIRLASPALAVIIGTASFAAETLRVGELSIHATAFAASALSPQVAERVGLGRDPHRGVLNVTIAKDRRGSTVSSGIAQVEARIVHPESMQGPIAMREIRDGTAISYMGEFALPEPTTVEVEIRVRPAGLPETQIFRLKEEIFD
jgi:hypothetical protein